MNTDEYRAIVDVLLGRVDSQARPASDGSGSPPIVGGTAQPASIPEDPLLRLYALLTSPHALPALRVALSLTDMDVDRLIGNLAKLIPEDRREELDKEQFDPRFPLGCVPNGERS